MSSGWTPRDLDIVETLTCRVRLLTLSDIVSIWWTGSARRSAERRLKLLREAKLLSVARISCYPDVVVTKPLIRWSPGQQDPDLAPVAELVKSRWNRPERTCTVYAASSLAANLWGSSATHFPQPSHWAHDLLLARVYTLYRRRWPDEAALWIGEDALPKAGYRVKDPDVFLIDEEGQIQRVIESAGRYSLRQLESFHGHCADQQLPYELW